MEEQVVLQSVVDELTTVRDELRRDHAAAIEIQQVLLKFISGSAPDGDSPDSQLDALFGATAWGNDPTHYSAPVLSALVSSGGLSIISDPSLRLELGAWSARLNTVAQTVSRDQTILFDRLLPFYRERGILPQVLSSSECKPGVADVCWSPAKEIEVRQQLDLSSLVIDTQAQGFFAERLVTVGDMIEFGFGGLDDQLSATIEEIKSQLE